MDESEYMDGLIQPGPMEGLRMAVSVADETIKDLTSDDADKRLTAVLDMGDLLRYAKQVVLDA